MTLKFSGQRLREARKAKGMSQEDLARAAGTTTSTVTRMEREVHEPYSNTSAKIANALDVPLDSLFTETPEPEEAPA